MSQLVRAKAPQEVLVNAGRPQRGARRIPTDSLRGLGDLGDLRAAWYRTSELNDTAFNRATYHHVALIES